MSNIKVRALNAKTVCKRNVMGSIARRVRCSNLFGSSQTSRVYLAWDVPATRAPSLAHGPNLVTRWRVLRTPTTQTQWQFSLAVNIHANFFQGTTSLGDGSCDRFSPN